MKDGSTMILYANGNVSHSKKHGVWKTTNNKVKLFYFKFFTIN